jgi:hypothetical protein
VQFFCSELTQTITISNIPTYKCSIRDVGQSGYFFLAPMGHTLIAMAKAAHVERRAKRLREPQGGVAADWEFAAEGRRMPIENVPAFRGYDRRRQAMVIRLTKGTREYPDGPKPLGE